MSVPSAKEMRDQADAILRIEVTSSIIKFRSAVENAVKSAASKGLHRVTVAVPDEIGPSTADQMVAGFRKLGYRATLVEDFGTLATNLYMPPTRSIVLFW